MSPKDRRKKWVKQRVRGGRVSLKLDSEERGMESADSVPEVIMAEVRKTASPQESVPKWVQAEMGKRSGVPKWYMKRRNEEKWSGLRGRVSPKLDSEEMSKMEVCEASVPEVSIKEEVRKQRSARKVSSKLDSEEWHKQWIEAIIPIGRNSEKWGAAWCLFHRRNKRRMATNNRVEGSNYTTSRMKSKRLSGALMHHIYK